MKFPEMFSSKKSESRPILPEDVRYALQYKNSLLNKQEIESLIRNNFENEALYLILKSLVDNPERHKAFLEKYVNSVLGSTNDKEGLDMTLQQVLRDELNKDTSNDISVQAGKLAQLSRQGFDLWQERLKSTSADLSEDEHNIFLIAHAMLIGLKQFIEAFSKQKKDLNIILPVWLENENIGYHIVFKEGKAEIEWLQGSFNHIDPLLVDDTQNSGHTFNMVQDYFIKHGFPKPELLAVSSH